MRFSRSCTDLKQFLWGLLQMYSCPHLKFSWQYAFGSIFGIQWERKNNKFITTNHTVYFASNKFCIDYVQIFLCSRQAVTEQKSQALTKNTFTRALKIFFDELLIQKREIAGCSLSHYFTSQYNDWQRKKITGRCCICCPLRRKSLSSAGNSFSTTPVANDLIDSGFVSMTVNRTFLRRSVEIAPWNK